ncbi:MAG TPA: hypothetical protein PLS03_09655 [Terrimicrobiaceae bacterium]|nr:hypothetical protein [Terrimicrobiaceae bacterium]
MIYPISLQQAGILAGVLVLLAHAAAWFQPDLCKRWLKGFPRSRAAGTVLIVVAAVWSLVLISNMDLGEFARLRNVMIGGIVAGAFLSWRYVEEFLAVRALGMILLLAAEPLLEAAFLRPEASRLLLVVLAYGWIIAGLFWVGLPWLMRDQVAWVTAKPRRFQTAALAGVVYGAAILVCALAFWK